VSKKALFLDRDGIINFDYGYVYKVENFEFTEGVFDLLHLFKKQDYLLFIVTNQSGIGRGYYAQEDFNTLTVWMLEQFEVQGIHIEAVRHCPHSPEENCACRKPKTGMIESILSHYPINLAKSWMIGDKQSDMDLASNAGIGSSISIGEQKRDNASLHFETISQAKQYFLENTVL